MFFGSYGTNKNNKMNDTLNDSSNETLFGVGEEGRSIMAGGASIE